ncbi:hypothetical protein J7413_00190 [Shimia sp. R10_1]|uniref:SecDF P1 head subdomain-containing protein n=1 Tax=Shimia sp. R10_1 TaxID=2821095 RepID=UPI001AD9D28B|nr:hypothetical protein [Shimia sp. R10_1]MBO9471945.1 hypothetical protein [Shimia sp. R10_1]
MLAGQAVAEQQCQTKLNIVGWPDGQSFVHGGHQDLTDTDFVGGDLLVKTEQVVSAEASTDMSGNPALTVSVTSDARRRFSEYTAKNLQMPIGVFLNDQLLSAPIVLSPIQGGTMMLTGFLSDEHAQQTEEHLMSAACRGSIGS